MTEMVWVQRITSSVHDGRLVTFIIRRYTPGETGVKQMRTAGEALRKNKTSLLAVLERYQVINPRLFGSLARGEADSESDIDILVTKTAPMDYATIGDMRREAAEALGWPVDIVFDSALKPELRQNIQHELRPLP